MVAMDTKLILSWSAPAPSNPSNPLDPPSPSSFSHSALPRPLELLAEVEWEKQLAREARRKDGLALKDVDEEEDYLGVTPLIERLKKEVKDLENIDQY
ncbi:Ribosomal protein S5 family protein [Canna indica]|uniref:Ribosomal protein S5 family protein n=1 Tax=Canna indica TaxID=4628 RepID=A0AAQ3PZH7_9LILI|nr:Ribosomal protein S5 family protein [Canna indica]